MLWDVALGEGKPIKKFAEHEHEVYSVDWNLVNKAPPPARCEVVSRAAGGTKADTGFPW